jgi:uncharacterized SAM-binding protein YcdF (DUF218 family)
VLLGAMAVGLWLSRGKRGARWDRARIGRGVAWAAWLTLWLLSTPWIASSMARWIGSAPRDLRADLEGSTPEQRAMVVLASGIYPPEHGVPAMARLSESGLERCVGAAGVYHAHGFRWVIVSGRHPRGGRTELAGGMADLLAALGVPRERILLEPDSTDTRENALNSTRMIRDLHVDKVVVVTSALHMPRAQWLFERAGLTVIPAPTRLDPPPAPGIFRLLPSALALQRSQRVVHELIGRLEP